MILLIDALDSFTYNLVQAFQALGQTVQVARFDEVDLPAMQAMQPQAVVLSPGPGHPTECLPHMQLAQSDWAVPVLGVCLGHQALVAGSGGQVVRAHEPLHGEMLPINHDGSGLFAGLPQPLQVGRYHSLIADAANLPACWQVTATSMAQGMAHSVVRSVSANADQAQHAQHRGDSGGGEIMAIAHRSLPRWGVQFHPESILTPQGPQLIANFLKLAAQ